jgi:hypothetical protein
MVVAVPLGAMGAMVVASPRLEGHRLNPRKSAGRDELFQDQATVCRRLGITTRSLQRYMKDPGFPDCSAGYNLPAIREWQALHAKPITQARSAAIELDLRTKRWKEKRERIRARKEQLQIEQLEGELLPRRTFELAIAQILTRIGDWAEQLPELIRGECCEVCRDKIEGLLRKELNAERQTAANDLSNLDASPRNFNRLIEALQEADCKKVAEALRRTCLTPV